MSEIERGQKEASSELLAAICAALDVPLSEVLFVVSDAVALEEAALAMQLESIAVESTSLRASTLRSPRASGPATSSPPPPERSARWQLGHQNVGPLLLRRSLHRDPEDACPAPAAGLPLASVDPVLPATPEVAGAWSARPAPCSPRAPLRAAYQPAQVEHLADRQHAGAPRRGSRARPCRCCRPRRGCAGRAAPPRRPAGSASSRRTRLVLVPVRPEQVRTEVADDGRPRRRAAAPRRCRARSRPPSSSVGAQHDPGLVRRAPPRRRGPVEVPGALHLRGGCAACARRRSGSAGACRARPSSRPRCPARSSVAGRAPGSRSRSAPGR